MVEPSERLNSWMDGYLDAWASNDPDAIAALFTDDAVYDPQTASGEWDGIDSIIENWLDIGDDPDNWDFQWLPIVETDDLAVIVGKTHYHNPAMIYRNLFVIRFDSDFRCTDFTEWYIEEDNL
ncbi:MAG TPA: nuclear transport factor 2 family protein [Acidimicrobiia bacterium]